MTGTDFAGPITIKRGKPRKPEYTKGYICVFVSFSVKAVHIVAVTDLSAEAFIACLRRFIAMRGKPADLYSDNVTKFVGANNELKALYDCLQERDNGHNILELCTTADIK